MIVKSVLKDLSVGHIPFVFLRDRDCIQESINSGRSDIDIFVQERFWTLIAPVLNKRGFYNLFGDQLFRSPYHDSILDFYHGSYKRIPFLEEWELVSTSTGPSDFPFLPEHILLAVLLLHPLDLTGFRGQRSYSEARRHVIKSYWENPQVKRDFLGWLEERVGKKFARAIAFVVEMRFDDLTRFVWPLRLLMYFERPSYFVYPFRRVMEKIIPVPSKRGRVIAVMGVDGAGKSSLIAELSKFVATYYNSPEIVRYSYMGRQGGFRLPLVPLSRMWNCIRRWKPDRSNLPGDRTTLKHAISPEGRATQTFERGIWRFIFPLEYTVRLLEILYLTRLRRKIVFTDRYIDDFAQDKSMGFLLSILSRLFPESTHVIFIKGDPQRFFDRKGEYSPGELAVMQEKLLSKVMASHGSNVTVVDGNQDISGVFGQALAALSRI